MTHNNNRKVFDGAAPSNSNGLALCNFVITGGALFDSIKTAINSGRNYITLAFRSEDGSSPWWALSPYGGNPAYSSSPAIELTLKYKANLQSYQFVNKIESSENSDSLVVKNIDKSTSNKISSGTTLALTLNTNYSATTNLLPFVVNWNSTGNTEKHSSWIANSNNNYALSYNFKANLNLLAGKLTSNFTPTKASVIQANLVEVSINNIPDSIISLKDPWYYSKDQNNNWINSNIFKNYPSPLNIQNNSLSSYGGVFLNQNPDPNDATKPYYLVKASQTQHINLGSPWGTRAFYFQNWSANTATSASLQNANALETAVVFKEAGATVTANYKGHFLSNSSAALANNGQRKVVRDKNGIYHMVYASMNSIWYSKSVTTNYQGAWSPDEKLIDYGSDVILSNPSLDVNTGTVGPLYDEKLSIAFEAYVDAGEAGVMVVTKDITWGVVNSSFAFVPIDPLYFGSAKPVVASFGDEIVVVYKYSSSSPLNCLRYYLSGSTWTKIEPAALPNTNSSSVNPSVASNSFPLKSNNLVQIVWQQGSAIKHESSVNSVSYNPGSARTFSYNDISFGSGNTLNGNPTVIDYNGAAKIAWIGGRKINGVYQYRTTYREISAGGVKSVFSNSGSNINSPTLGSAGSPNGFILGWSANNGANNYFTDEGLSLIYPLNIIGKDLQLCNGAGKSAMYATSFTNSSLPYYFTQSNDIQSLYNISKTNSAGINKGREGVVAKGSGELYFTIGDVNVNGENISFITLPDTFSVASVNDVNNYVRTIPFAITDNSRFFYSVQYGITDSAEVVNSLTVNDVVSFRVELVDEATNVALGMFDNVSFTKQQALPYENISYQVATEGIGNRTVYLRLVTTATEGCSFSLANLLDNQNIIAKRAINQISFKSAAVIKEYALAQNYPNPFNPTTTITYQLPKSGSVTLKIFDMLGNEVKTLVNEQKEMGRYTVQFDASSLASGMYVYQLRVNDYTSTKKMMLLK